MYWLIRKPYFWAGLLVRIFSAPFLLQWFHPDERQLFEFAHFHAHGRLHPFMEAQLHMRNQSLPWLFSKIVLFLDWVNIGSPWTYLTSIHLVLGLWSWIGFCALIILCKELSDDKTSDFFGWFLAVFWAFPLLYSRQLLEAVSLPSTLLLLLMLKRRAYVLAGAFAGLTAALRYPSALWAIGGLLVIVWGNFEARRLRSVLYFSFAAAIVFGMGGFADYFTHGTFMESLPAYFQFNMPHGPVEKMFGSDSLYVYWRWFEFLFTPWGALIILLAGCYALIKKPILLLFTLPYLIGHIWTPHREPRFMLPVTPLLLLAIALTYQEWKFNFRLKTLGPRTKQILIAILSLHIIFNFAWIPLNIWAQTESAQAAVIINYKKIAQTNIDLITFADPLIDALVPPNISWLDRDCTYHRPHETHPKDSFALLSANFNSHCTRISEPLFTDLTSPLLQRLFRIRTAELLECPMPELVIVCKEGTKKADSKEPYFGKTL